MTHHLGGARLTAASPPRGPGKTPLGDEALLASFKRETVYKLSSHIRRTHITVMRRRHSFSSLIPHMHFQTHSQRRCLGHTSFSIHGGRRVYSVPRFQPGIDPFIGHPSRNGKMPVYRAPCICSDSSGHYNLHDPRVVC